MFQFRFSFSFSPAITIVITVTIVITITIAVTVTVYIMCVRIGGMTGVETGRSFEVFAGVTFPIPVSGSVNDAIFPVERECEVCVTACSV